MPTAQTSLMPSIKNTNFFSKLVNFLSSKKITPNFLIFASLISGVAVGLNQAALSVILIIKFGSSTYSILTISTVFLLSSYFGTLLFQKLKINNTSKSKIYLGIIGLTSIVSLYSGHIVEVIESSQTNINILTYRSVIAIFIGLPLAISTTCLLPTISMYTNTALENLSAYAINLSGNAIGWFLCFFYLVPNFGVNSAFQSSAAIFIVFAFFIIYLLQKNIPDSKNILSNSTNSPAVSIFILSFATGFVFFSNEFAWLHIAKIFIGSSIFSEPIVLISIFINTSLGVFLYKYLIIKKNPNVLLIANLLQSISILFFILILPNIIDGLGFANLIVPKYLRKELFYFIIFLFISLPFFISCAFPFCEILKSTSSPATLYKLIGLNTLGSIAGIFCHVYIQISTLGGFDTIIMNSLIILISILIYLFNVNVPINKKIGALSLVFLLVSHLLVKNYNWNNIWTGSANYLKISLPTWYKLVHQQEGFGYGYLTVLEGKEQTALLSNGLFQGNNQRELTDQLGFAISPHLFLKSPDKVLNIGLGVGGTAGALARMPYHQIDVVELFPEVFEVAKKNFPDSMQNLITSKKARLIFEDGRFFLTKQTANKTYSLITIEAYNMWLGGASNLYSDEFYKTVSKKLTTNGVLQQWLQLHHVNISTLTLVLNTVKKNFNYVNVWIPNYQGMIIASNEPISIVPSRLLEAQQALSIYPKNISGRLMQGSFLSNDDVTCLLSNVDTDSNYYVSNDNNQRIAYNGFRDTTWGWNFMTNINEMRRLIYQKCPPPYRSQSDIWLNLHPDGVGF